MCASYNPPVESLTEFNTAVFKQDDTPLTKMKSLFLGRVGNPISVATSTRFNGGDIYVQGATVGLGAGSIATNTAFGYNALFQNTTGANNLAIGYSALDANTYGFNNVAIGTNSGGAITTGSRNVAVGFEAFKTGTIYNNSVALGASTVVAGNQAVAIGYLASASDSQIVLGTSAETVLCKGTTGNGSLIASADIYINGVRAGLGKNSITNNTCFGKTTLSQITAGQNNCAFGNTAGQEITIGNSNSCFGVGALKNVSTGSKNTCMGSTAAINLTGNSVDNTFIGNDAGTNCNGVSSSNTFVGSQSGRSTLDTISSATALGFQTRCDFANSTVIGIGATATAINQITLGRTTEFVQCPGTSATGSIKLGGSIQLQSSYTAAPTSAMLGYQLQGSTAFNSFIYPDDVTSISINLTAGVWSISTTYEFKNVHVSQATEVYRYHMYISFTNGGAFANRYLYGGTLGFNEFVTQITYPPDSSPLYDPQLPSVYSTSFTYYTNSSVTLYPSFMMAYSGGTLNRNVRYTATRIA